jgi:hypothetical protein
VIWSGGQATAPDAFGGDTQDQVVGQGGHHLLHGALQRGVDAADQLVEVRVAAHRVIGDVHTRDMVGHARNPEVVVLGLDHRVGGRRDDAEGAAPTEHVAVAALLLLQIHGLSPALGRRGACKRRAGLARRVGPA